MDVLSVSQLNRYVKSVLDSDPRLGEVFVRGEISSLSAHGASGHLYLTLKDDKTSIRAVMFKGNASYLRFKPQNGLQVLVRGQATLFERDGAFQLYISDMQLDGVGAMFAAFEKLRAQLESEGLFAESRKRPLPRLPRVIGVVTSADGAALQDIIKVLSRRYPVGRLCIVPAYVQGAQAVPSLMGGLRVLAAMDDCDVIILGRGGGSIEDLWAFNEEPLVRAVADCTKPVISAVGHETDFTLCDFAADLRAPTPSAAAELVAPDLTELSAAIAGMEARMQQHLLAKVDAVKYKLAGVETTLSHTAFALVKRQAHVQDAAGRLALNMRAIIGRKRQEVGLQVATLDAKSPLRTLARGYTLTTDTEGGLLMRHGPPVVGQALITRYSWGETRSTVDHVEVYDDEKAEL